MTLPWRLLLIALAAAGMGGLLFAFDRALTERAAAARGDDAVARVHATDRPIAAAERPIAAEALVFRTRPADLAVDAGTRRRTGSHPRTLATFRALRAYPGAPPRVPHGLTADEFRRTLCNGCHERGGYSARFAAYVPVTPHPELADCLQCHATDATVTGTPLPGRQPDDLCRQCHTPSRPATAALAVDWTTLSWPAARGAGSDGTPPEIPHDLDLRGNCLACHAGPGAIAEIRTTHPERANCRQCHVTPFADSFAGAPALPEGGTP